MWRPAHLRAKHLMALAGLIFALLTTLTGAPAARSGAHPWDMSAPLNERAVATDATQEAPSLDAAAQRHSDPARGVPLTLDIPSVGIYAPLQPIEMDTSGVLTPPTQASVAGWWTAGVLPGSPRGTVLITGHTVHDGGGVFDDLPDLEPGRAVRVRTEHGTVRYRVATVRSYPKEQLARHAPHLFSTAGRSRLALVTCSDYHHGEYHANTVVIAEPQWRSR